MHVTKIIWKMCPRNTIICAINQHSRTDTQGTRSKSDAMLDGDVQKRRWISWIWINVVERLWCVNLIQQFTLPLKRVLGSRIKTVCAHTYRAHKCGIRCTSLAKWLHRFLHDWLIYLQLCNTLMSWIPLKPSWFGFYSRTQWIFDVLRSSVIVTTLNVFDASV